MLQVEDTFNDLASQSKQNNLLIFDRGTMDATACEYSTIVVELEWRSGSVMDCHTTARGLIPGGNGVFTELHVLRKGQ